MAPICLGVNVLTHWGLRLFCGSPPGHKHEIEGFVTDWSVTREMRAVFHVVYSTTPGLNVLSDSKDMKETNASASFKNIIPLVHIHHDGDNAKLINSLWPSDAIWRQGSRSTLVQVVACCLMAPSHYLNQCWPVISKIQLHSSDGNFTWDTPVISD